MGKVALGLGVVLVFCGPAVSLSMYRSHAAERWGEQTAGRQSPSTLGALTNKDVLTMVKAGLSSAVIVAKIKSSTCEFDTSPTELADLKKAGVPDAVILVMVQASPDRRAKQPEDSAKPTASTATGTEAPPELRTPAPVDLAMPKPRLPVTSSISAADQSEQSGTTPASVPSGVQAVNPAINSVQETKPVPESTKNTAGVGIATGQDTKNITCLKYEISANLWPDENMQGNDIGTIPCGEPVTVLSRPSKNFAQTIKVRTKDGKDGYVPGRFLGLASSNTLVNGKAAKFDKREKNVCSKHIGWSEAQCAAVAEHRVLVGMSGEMVIAALGRPSTINRQVLADVVQDQWVFGHDSLDIPYQGKNYHMWAEEWSYVYLQNGIVTAIQTQPVHPY